MAYTIFAIPFLSYVSASMMQNFKTIHVSQVVCLVLDQFFLK